jgi:hypothetical protein
MNKVTILRKKLISYRSLIKRKTGFRTAKNDPIDFINQYLGDDHFHLTRAVRIIEDHLREIEE